MAWLIARPAVTVTRGGKQLTFVILFLLPIITASMGAAEQMHRSEETQFCLSCHLMEAYGKSLLVDDATYLERGGIPSISFGPGNVMDAHTVNESVSCDEVIDACKVLAATVLQWCGV